MTAVAPPVLKLHCTITCEQDHEILRQNLTPNLEKTSCPFLRTMVSDLEVPILIPTVSHLTANRSTESLRSLPDHANGTTSSAKSKDEILTSPNWNPSAPRSSVHKRYEQNHSCIEVSPITSRQYLRLLPHQRCDVLGPSSQFGQSRVGTPRPTLSAAPQDTEAPDPNRPSCSLKKMCKKKLQFYIKSLEL